MRVPTLSEIKQEIKKRVSYIHALAIELLKVQERCAQASNKYFDELDTFIQEALLAGLEESGKYSQNALALLFRDIVGIELTSPDLLVRLLIREENPKVRIIHTPRPEIWRPIRFVGKISKKILDIVGMEPISIDIDKPIDFAEGFTELLNELVRILPQFNEKTLLIWSLADNVRWYLLEISKPENSVYPYLSEMKDLLQNLGVSIIKSWSKPKYEEYNILGYTDYAKSLCLGRLFPHSFKDLRLLLFDLSECSTLGGGLCKLIEISYELLRNLSLSHQYARWFENVKDFEREYVGKLLDRIVNLGKLKVYQATVFLKLFNIELPLANLRKIRHMLFIDKARDDGINVFHTEIPLFEYNDNLIIENKFSIFELLDEIAPLMFLRLLDFVIIGDKKAFLLLLRY